MDPGPAGQIPSSGLPRLIEAARGGSAQALGELFEACRPYLLLLANQQLRPDIRGKVSPSDLVQESFLKAHGHFEQFNGRTEEELLGWLRRILLNTLANTVRHYQGADKRHMGREVALDGGDSGIALEKEMVAPGPSPSSGAIAGERDAALRRALQQLPEEYQRVIHLRNLELRPFEEIGRLTGRSAEAARKVWVRAIEQLRDILGPPHESSG